MHLLVFIPLQAGFRYFYTRTKHKEFETLSIKSTDNMTIVGNSKRLNSTYVSAAGECIFENARAVLNSPAIRRFSYGVRGFFRRFWRYIFGSLVCGRLVSGAEPARRPVLFPFLLDCLLFDFDRGLAKMLSGMSRSLALVFGLQL